MTATKATEKVIWDIKTVNCPFEEGKPIMWLDDIKNIADIILSKNGGDGCFRELAEIIKSNLNVW